MTRFTKMQAYGNDYVYIDAINQKIENKVGYGHLEKPSVPSIMLGFCERYIRYKQFISLLKHY